jgi:uncharacterized protein YbjT (DUF2867 family)
MPLPCTRRAGGHTTGPHTAVSRLTDLGDPKAPTAWNGHVTIVVGELDDAAAVDRALQGADAVVSALGPTLDRMANRPAAGRRQPATS